MGVVDYSVTTYQDPNNASITLTSRTLNAWEPDTLTRKVNPVGYEAYDFNIVSGLTRSTTAFCNTNALACKVNMTTSFFQYQNRQPYTYTGQVPDICVGVDPIPQSTTGAVVTTGAVAPLPTPYLYYDFDINSNGMILDQSGNARHATIMGSTLPTIVQGKYGNAIRFARMINNVDVGDQYLNVGTVNLQYTVTVAAWIRIPSSAMDNYMKIVSSKVLWNDPSGFEVEYNPSLNQFACLGSGATVSFARNQDIQANVWRHITVIIDNASEMIIIIIIIIFEETIPSFSFN